MNLVTRKFSLWVRLSRSGYRLYLMAFTGVTFYLVKRGLDDRTFESGLKVWRSRHMREVTEDASAV